MIIASVSLALTAVTAARAFYCWRKAIYWRKEAFISAENKRDDFNEYWADIEESRYWEDRTRLWALFVLLFFMVGLGALGTTLTEMNFSS